jgi:hypothetical protein
MTAQNNTNTLGDYCNHYDTQESDGGGNGKTSIKSMHISETIMEIDSPQSSMTIHLLWHYSGLQVDGISMMTSIGGQQEMVMAQKESKLSMTITNL